MKKILIGGVLVVAIGAYVWWSSSHTAAPTTSAPHETTNPNGGNNPTTTTDPTPVTSTYKDGTYTGVVANAFYGDLQLQATIQGGKLVDVVALTFPNDRQTTIDVSNMSLPILKKEAITIQGSKVDIVSGATQTSEAYQQSLESALVQARA